MFGGRADCRHEWITEQVAPKHNDDGIVGDTLQGGKATQAQAQRSPIEYAFCRHCQAWLGSYGLEPSISLFVQHTVEVCREIKRVLRPDGVFWLNIGDSFATGKNGRSAADGKALGSDDRTFRDKPFSVTEVPAKNLCLIPQRVVIALQDDGWIVRSAPVWEKANPMPESVRDRPGTAHEYIYMLVKSAKYWWDNEAVRRGFADSRMGNPGNFRNGYSAGAGRNDVDTKGKAWNEDKSISGRSLRTSDFFFDSLDAAIAHLTAIRDTGGLLLAGDGGPGAFVVNPKGYSVNSKNDKEIDRYGHPYDRIDKVSPDCPIHSHLLDSQKSEAPGYDEQPNQNQTDIIDNGNNLAQASFFEPSAKNSPSLGDTYSFQGDDFDRPTSQPQMPESIGEYKNEVCPHEHILDDETQSRTNHKSVYGEHQDYKMDYSHLDYSQIAIDHNIQSHKTDHAPLTSFEDNASAETAFHTGDMSTLPLMADLAERTSENNTEGDSASYEQGLGLSEQRVFHNEDSKILSSGNCTCKLKKVKTDHYATFPLALVTPMVLASAPDKCCPKCGKGWVRVVDKGLTGTIEDRPNNGMPGRTGKGFTKLRAGDSLSSTLGFRPGCACMREAAPNFGMRGDELLELIDEKAREFAPIPGVVLDPFAGSGTVGQACRELGRRFIGLDLSLKYLTENALARSERKTSAAVLATLPLFADMEF